MKIPSLITIIWDLILISRPINVTIVLLIGSIVNTIIVPKLYVKFNQNYMNDFDYSIRLLIFYFISKIFSKFLDYYTDPIKQSFYGRISTSVTQQFNCIVHEMSYNDFRKINKDDLDKKKRRVMWSIKSLIRQIISASFTVMSMVGAFLVMFNIFKCSIVIYIVAYYLFFQLFFKKVSQKLAKQSGSMYDKLWRYWTRCKSIDETMIVRLIHGQKEKSLDELANLNKIILRNRGDNDKLQKLMSSAVCSLNTIISAMCVVIYINMNILENNDTWYIPFYHANILNNFKELPSETQLQITTEFIVFIIYLQSISSYTYHFENLYTQFCKMNDEYIIFSKMMGKVDKQVEYEQVKINDSFEILELELEKSDDKRHFRLYFPKPIKFNRGDMVLVKGKSGSGKSTLYDILAGVVLNDKYSAKLRIDDEDTDAKFGSFSSIRSVTLQDEECNWDRCLFEIITQIGYYEEKKELIFPDPSVDVKDLSKKINEVLEKVNALDFVKTEDFIFEKLNRDSLSGGQKSRVVLGKSLYRVFNRNSDIVIFDEPDKGIHDEMKVKIVKEIIKYCDENNKFLFFTAHSGEIHKKWKEMTGAKCKIINVEDGCVTESV
jgi:putative ABC transport system ATP-binding protein